MIYGIGIAILLATILLILLLQMGATWDSWYRSMGFLALTYVVTNIPIIYVLVDSALESGEFFLTTFWRERFNYGEVFVYIAAIIGPVLVTLILNQYKLWGETSIKRFRASLTYIAINFCGILCCFLLAILLYHRQSVGAESDVKLSETLALSLYILSLTMWYFSLVYDRIIFNADPGNSATDRARKISESLSP